MFPVSAPPDLSSRPFPFRSPPGLLPGAPGPSNRRAAMLSTAFGGADGEDNQLGSLLSHVSFPSLSLSLARLAR